MIGHDLRSAVSWLRLGPGSSDRVTGELPLALDTAAVAALMAAD